MHTAGMDRRAHVQARKIAKIRISHQPASRPGFPGGAESRVKSGFNEIEPHIMKIELSPVERQYLRGLAHGLNPVVMIGNNGVTDAVIREIAVNLDAHELIKIRVLGDDRELRQQYLERICDELSAAPVQHLGKLLIIYRASSTDKPRITLPKAKKKAN